MLVVDPNYAKQVDMTKIKESNVYNYKVQFEPQISFLQNLDKLAGDDNNFDIKDLIQNLNTVEEKKPQVTNSPTDVDDLNFALPTVLPPIAPPIVLTTVSSSPSSPSSPSSTEMTTKAPITTTASSDLPEVPTELPPSEPIELPPSETALIEAEESETEVVATTVTAGRETGGVKPVEREEESGWMTPPASNNPPPPVFQPATFNFMSSMMFPFQKSSQHQCPCHSLVLLPQLVFQPRYLVPRGLFGYRWPTFPGGYHYNTNINNRWTP